VKPAHPTSIVNRVTEAGGNVWVTSDPDTLAVDASRCRTVSGRSNVLCAWMSDAPIPP
jgi:hypothetical protein